MEQFLQNGDAPTITAVLNAGGRATRMNGLFTPDEAKGIAKAIRLDIGAQAGLSSLTLVDHQINQLSSVSEIDSIVVSAGDQQVVADYVETQYADSEHIHATLDTETYGTAGDLITAVRAHPELFGELLVVGNVDTIVRIDYTALIARFQQTTSDAMIALTQRRDAKNADAFIVGSDGAVIYSDEFSGFNRVSRESALPFAAQRGASTGVVALRTQFLRESQWSPEDGEYSIYKDLLGHALGSRGLTCFNNHENFVRDVATRESWNASRNDPELQAELWYSTSK